MKIVIALLVVLCAMLVVLKDMSVVRSIETQAAEYEYSEDFKPNLNNPAELGYVHWIRNFESALQRAKTEDKPILVFFNEVPGCSTASGYGKNVFRHPLIIEASETLFVP
ncbi:MAG: hypothetical protein GTN99_03745, partial [Candidatus Dadabacteria bacterium]|nr:hypothetical protein [Candidatus Dadabacteria bacterium]